MVVKVVVVGVPTNYPPSSYMGSYLKGGQGGGGGGYYGGGGAPGLQGGAAGGSGTIVNATYNPSPQFQKKHLHRK